MWEEAYLLCDCSSRQCNSNHSPAMFSVLAGYYSVIMSVIFAFGAHKPVRLIDLEDFLLFFAKYVGCGLHTGVLYL